MSKSEIARIRMEPETYGKWALEAQNAEMPLGPYLLQKLEEGSAQEALLHEIRQTLSRIEHQSQGGTKGTTDHIGAIVELLLLTRQIAGPQKVKIAQGEVVRLGLKLWGEES